MRGWLLELRVRAGARTHTPAQTHAFAQTCPATAIDCQQPPPSLAALHVRGSETKEELKGVRTRAWRNAPVVFEAMRLTSVTCVSARAPRFRVSKRTGWCRASAWHALLQIDLQRSGARRTAQRQAQTCLQYIVVLFSVPAAGTFPVNARDCAFAESRHRRALR